MFCGDAIEFRVMRLSERLSKLPYYVYILTNKSGTLYTGVTNNLGRRCYEHKSKVVKGFTSKYNIDKLVYYQVFEDIDQAIIIEKRIKGWKREKKITLINSFNPEWIDLTENSIL